MTPAPVPTPPAIEVEVLQVLSVATLCRASGADAGQLQALVGAGVLRPIGGPVDACLFAAQALPLTRTALRLARDLELDIADVALVMALLAEIDRLRAQLRRLGADAPVAGDG